VKTKHPRTDDPAIGDRDMLCFRGKLGSLTSDPNTHTSRHMARSPVGNVRRRPGVLGTTVEARPRGVATDDDEEPVPSTGARPAEPECLTDCCWVGRSWQVQSTTQERARTDQRSLHYARVPECRAVSGCQPSDYWGSDALCVPEGFMFVLVWIGSKVLFYYGHV
jgi:hypothetical protein